jgi:hypothetical protein
MNEPSNMLDGPKEGTCEDENLPYKPHTPEPLMRSHTICMDARQAGGAHSDLHNLYAISEAAITHL